MRRHRGSPLWIAGRIGILIVFGVMPMQRACYRMKHPYVPSAPQFDYSRFDEAMSNARAALHPYDPSAYSNWLRIEQEELKKAHEYNAIHFPVNK